MLNNIDTAKDRVDNLRRKTTEADAALERVGTSLFEEDLC